MIHRFYGSISVDGEQYRVKTTVVETRDGELPIYPHSYEGENIELLPESNSSELELTVSPENFGVPREIAKLLKGVEKSYDPGVKLLDESAKIKDNLSEIENRTGKQTHNATTESDDVWSKPWGESAKRRLSRSRRPAICAHA